MQSISLLLLSLACKSHFPIMEWYFSVDSLFYSMLVMHPCCGWGGYHLLWMFHNFCIRTLKRQSVQIWFWYVDFFWSATIAMMTAFDRPCAECWWGHNLKDTEQRLAYVNESAAMSARDLQDPRALPTAFAPCWLSSVTCTQSHHALSCSSHALQGVCTSRQLTSGVHL